MCGVVDISIFERRYNHVNPTINTNNLNNTKTAMAAAVAPIALLEFIQRSKKKVWLQISPCLSASTVFILNRMLENEKTSDLAYVLIEEYQRAVQFHYSAIFLIKMTVSFGSNTWKRLNLLRIPTVPTEEMIENYVAYFNPPSTLWEKRSRKAVHPVVAFLMEILKLYFNDGQITAFEKQDLDDSTKARLERDLENVIASLSEPDVSIPEVRETFLQNLVKDQFSPTVADEILANLPPHPTSHSADGGDNNNNNNNVMVSDDDDVVLLQPKMARNIGEKFHRVHLDDVPSSPDDGNLSDKGSTIMMEQQEEKPVKILRLSNKTRMMARPPPPPPPSPPPSIENDTSDESDDDNDDDDVE